MGEKISIIMPAYNGAKYIETTIKSIQAQTYVDWELLVISDGSTDETVAIVQKLMESDTRIKCYEQENAGVSAARNTGLDKATGKYISFLDADDLWEPSILAKLYEAMQKDGGRKFVYARTDEIFDDGVKALIGPVDNTEGYLENFRHKTNELRLTFHISAMLIERALIEHYQLRFKVGIKISEDTGFFIQLLCVTEAHCVPEILSHYMRREQSATTKAWKPQDWEGQVTIYDKIVDFAAQKRPEAMADFAKMHSYVAYRFVRKCLKAGYYDESQTYIEKWLPVLQDFTNNGGKCMDRLKCGLMLACRENITLLKMTGRV